jgi:nitric oxide reductase NorQ protein
MKKLNTNYLLASRQAGGLVLQDKQNKIYNLPTERISLRKVKQSVSYGTAIRVVELEDGTLVYSTAQMGFYDKNRKNVKGKLAETQIDFVEVPKEVCSEQAETMKFIHGSLKLKPEALKMTELKWKYLIRSVVRGKNIMMTGSAGSGKTMAAKAVVNSLERPDFYFNLGATQDPRSTLIGNTHFSKKKGTFFSESLFVNAIQTPNAVILLDEISRAHPEAWNILMTVLDEGQRYLRLDEHPESPTVEVAKGVSFIATANQGNEYTSTRVIDRALIDRFTVIEMDLLTNVEEEELLTLLFPTVEKKQINAVAEIAHATRIELRTEAPRISTAISTRASVNLTGLLYDGFTLAEAADVIIYPIYPDDGGVDSERTFVKQLVQKYADVDEDGNIFNVEDEKEPKYSKV